MRDVGIIAAAVAIIAAWLTTLVGVVIAIWGNTAIGLKVGGTAFVVVVVLSLVAAIVLED